MIDAICRLYLPFLERRALMKDNRKCLNFKAKIFYSLLISLIKFYFLCLKLFICAF